MGRHNPISIKSALLLILLACSIHAHAITTQVGSGHRFAYLSQAIAAASPYDTLIVEASIHPETNIVIDKPLVLLGKGFPVLDGKHQTTVVNIIANDVHFEGFAIKHSSTRATDDPSGIFINGVDSGVVIKNNRVLDCFFGIMIHNSKAVRVIDNYIEAHAITELSSGNGIQCWKASDLQIIHNTVLGHRDGIYFEFVVHSIIWRNYTSKNVRYGLHFMFSNDDAYIGNVFKNNGAGVAVMYTKKVVMLNNKFYDNWGNAAYGLLLKDISDSYMEGNYFLNNTIGIFLDGANRIEILHNRFESNGWGMQLQANCMDNVINYNNFRSNSFDISTNGFLVMNNLDHNYWDKYEGYDLNKDGVGDVPFRPLSLFSVLVDKHPPTIFLYRSFIVSLLDRSEKVIPSLTPENFIDNKPRMKPYEL